jgi:hypothetical protein
MPRFVLSIMLIILAVTTAFADGDCPDRPASREERAAFEAVYSAAKAAVPPAPPDWVLKDETDPKTGTVVPNCPGSTNDLPKHYSLRFTYAYSSEASDREDKSAVGAALKGTPEQQTRMAELERKIAALEEQKKAARRDRDAAEKERVRQELKAAEKERDGITDAINGAYVKSALSGRLAAGMNRNKPAVREAELIIRVNERVALGPVHGCSGGHPRRADRLMVQDRLGRKARDPARAVGHEDVQDEPGRQPRRDQVSEHGDRDQRRAPDG